MFHYYFYFTVYSTTTVVFTICLFYMEDVPLYHHLLNNQAPMDENKLYIKNMVCFRCIMVVKAELAKLGIDAQSVELGEVTLRQKLGEDKKKLLNEILYTLGFSLIDDKRSRLIEQVKNLIIELVRKENNPLKVNLSEYLTQHIHHDYSYISNLFSEVTGSSIEKYYIAQKIERVKELLVYDELSLSEIADSLNYSSVAHLSAQFKKVTGFTPSYYKQIKEKKRKMLDEI